MSELQPYIRTKVFKVIQKTLIEHLAHLRYSFSYCVSQNDENMIPVNYVKDNIKCTVHYSTIKVADQTHIEITAWNLKSTKYREKM